MAHKKKLVKKQSVKPKPKVKRPALVKKKEVREASKTMAFKSPEEQKKEYLRVGEVQLISPGGERVNCKPEEVEALRDKGYGSEVWLWHETEAPYSEAITGGRIFLDHQVEEMLAKGWSETPVGPAVEKQKPKTEEKKKGR